MADGFNSAFKGETLFVCVHTVSSRTFLRGIYLQEERRKERINEDWANF